MVLISSGRAHNVDVVVIGGGLAGLATAITAQDAGLTTVVLEAATAPGGLARSFRRDGYTFDCSGHLLHLARPATRELVERHTKPSDWATLERRSAILCEDSLVPYPFQLHLGHAPVHIREECLATLPLELGHLGEDPEQVSFADWINATLGTGIAKHFMIPYNEKLSTVGVDELTCAWLGRFVPRPSIEDIRLGGASKRVMSTGYNQQFLYPVNGGIDLLARSFAPAIANLLLGQRVVSIDPDARLVETSAGDRFTYQEGLIATLPLADLPTLMGLKPDLVAAASNLRANVVTCVNVGFKHRVDRFGDLQWIYLPDKRYASYRVGLYDRFTSAMAPTGKSAAYVEIAHNATMTEREVVELAYRDLEGLDMIRDQTDIAVVHPVRIPIAYVIHDHKCGPARRRLHAYLQSVGILPVGRYARWEYASMEDALTQGAEAIAQIAGDPTQ